MAVAIYKNLPLLDKVLAALAAELILSVTISYGKPRVWEILSFVLSNLVLTCKQTKLEDKELSRKMQSLIIFY